MNTEEQLVANLVNRFSGLTEEEAAQVVRDIKKTAGDGPVTPWILADSLQGPLQRMSEHLVKDSNVLDLVAIANRVPQGEQLWPKPTRRQRLVAWFGKKFTRNKENTEMLETSTTATRPTPPPLPEKFRQTDVVAQRRSTDSVSTSGIPLVVHSRATVILTRIAFGTAIVAILGIIGVYAMVISTRTYIGGYIDGQVKHLEERIGKVDTKLDTYTSATDKELAKFGTAIGQHDGQLKALDEATKAGGAIEARINARTDAEIRKATPLIVDALAKKMAEIAAASASAEAPTGSQATTGLKLDIK